MKRRTSRLRLHRETLRQLTSKDLACILAAGTYTIEPPCEDTDYSCGCGGGGGQTGLPCPE